MKSFLARATGAVLVAACAGSCSLIVQKDGVQCVTNEDCTRRGGAFANSVCSMDRVCVAAAPACTVNSDCKQQPAVCRNSACVPLLSAECDHLIPQMTSVPDDAVVIATLFSLKGTNASAGAARTSSVELALGEIARDAVGLPPLAANGKPRPLIALACTDNDGMADIPEKAAAHIRDVGIQAMIGPGTSGFVTNVFNNVAKPAGIFLIAPAATSATLSSFMSPLFWRTAPSDKVQAKALALTITEVEAAYRAAAMLSPMTPTRLFMVNKDDSYGGGLAQDVSATATINGKVLNDPSNVPNFKGATYPPSTTNFSAIVSAILSFQPHIIALFGTAEVITQIIKPVEMGWNSPLRPAYLLSDGGKKPELLQLVAGNDPLRVRVQGTVPGTNSPSFNGFRNRYTSKFPGPFPDVFGMAGAYDSTYLVALAIASIGAQPITGAAIGDGMRRTVGGTKFVIGQDKTLDAFNVITSGKNLDVDGASGPLDFDLQTHEAPSDIDVFCIANQAMMPVFQSSGRFFDATTQKMAGVYNCP
jgi:branched-chain amino acid transport system substrate-binding protein